MVVTHSEALQQLCHFRDLTANGHLSVLISAKWTVRPLKNDLLEVCSGCLYWLGVFNISQRQLLCSG